MPKCANSWPDVQKGYQSASPMSMRVRSLGWDLSSIPPPAHTDRLQVASPSRLRRYTHRNVTHMQPGSLAVAWPGKSEACKHLHG